MNDLFESFTAAGGRYLLIGGQAMRLAGMPRFSMDGDFLIPSGDAENFAKLNKILDQEFDVPLIPLGPGGENFIQTYQTRWGVLQFHLGIPGVPRFEEVEQVGVIRKTEHGASVKCLSGPHMLAAKRAADPPRSSRP